MYSYPLGPYWPMYPYYQLYPTFYPTFPFQNTPEVKKQQDEHQLLIENLRQVKREESCDEILPQDLENIRQSKLKKAWTQSEDQQLLKLIEKQSMDWKLIAKKLSGRSQSMCYSRYRRLLMKTKTTYWKEQDDQLIKLKVNELGFKWKEISNFLPDRTAKQIRQRYLNFLRPNINKNEWSFSQDKKLIELVKQYGHKWKSFQQKLPGRTQNQIKSRYYGKLKKIVQIKSKK